MKISQKPSFENDQDETSYFLSRLEELDLSYKSRMIIYNFLKKEQILTDLDNDIKLENCK